MTRTHSIKSDCRWFKGLLRWKLFKLMLTYNAKKIKTLYINMKLKTVRTRIMISVKMQKMSSLLALLLDQKRFYNLFYFSLLFYFLHLIHYSPLQIGSQKNKKLFSYTLKKIPLFFVEKTSNERDITKLAQKNLGQLVFSCGVKTQVSRMIPLSKQLK